jgi:diguanylate cyclase (GGDEF)-like protein
VRRLLPSTTSLVAAALVALAALLALTAGLAPEAAEATQLLFLAQGVAELAAAAVCGAIAVRARGRSRWFWSLVAAWMGLYGAAALTFGIGTLAGWGAPARGDLDALWVPGYAPLVAALLVLHRELVGRRGWGGVLESLAIACALGLFVWEGLVAPVGPSAEGLLSQSAGLAAFAAIDLFCVCLVTWLIVRNGLRPRWMAALLGAVVAQALSDMLYLRASALGEAGSLRASSCLAVVTAALVAVMAARRLTGDRARVHGPLPTAPFWTQMLPLPVCFAAGVTAVLRPGERHLGVLALLALVAVMARLVVSARRAEHLARENARLARTDPLTGADNRRVLVEELGRAVSHADRSGAPLAAVALDLDRFKEVNDRLGHAMGDRLLVVAAELMHARLRASDRLFRLGGDEFLVLAPGSASGDALVLAERLVAAVADAGEALVPEVGVTASAGVAVYPGDAGGSEALLRRADDALYAAKGAGAGRAYATA